MNRALLIVSVRAKLKQGKPSIGTWMQIPSSALAEILGNAMYDWVAVDLEHGSIGLSKLPDINRAIELGGSLPLARLPNSDPNNCKQALDAGAGGVIVPMISSEKQMLDVIKSCCWPPIGERGVGYSRANLYGKYFNEYAEEATRPLIVGMIENKIAFKELEKIVKIKGLDALMIGPYDLSASMGIAGDFKNQDFIEAVSYFESICRANEMPYGFHVVQPDVDELFGKIENGYTFLAYSIDAVFFHLASINPAANKR